MTTIKSFVPTSEFWSYFNHWIVWANGCVRMPTFVKGMNRWTFEVKGTANGEPVHVSGSAPTLLGAVQALQDQMQQHLTEACFQSILAGAAGGGMEGRGVGPSGPADQTKPRPPSTCLCGRVTFFDPAAGAYRCANCGLIAPG